MFPIDRFRATLSSEILFAASVMTGHSDRTTFIRILLQIVAYQSPLRELNHKKL